MTPSATSSATSFSSSWARAWLPPERLREDDVTFYSAWSAGKLAAVGALKDLGDGRGELKSMRAAPEFRGKGAGKAVLVHLLGEAERRGYRWLGLETGRPEPFQPARRPAGERRPEPPEGRPVERSKATATAC